MKLSGFGLRPIRKKELSPDDEFNDEFREAVASDGWISPESEFSTAYDIFPLGAIFSLVRRCSLFLIVFTMLI